MVDLAGNELDTFNSRSVTNTLAETVPPVPTTAVLADDGVYLTLTFNEALRTASVPSKSAFLVEATPHGVVQAEEVDLHVVNPVAVSANRVTLRLIEPIAHNDTVKVTYTKPGSGSVIEDVFRNDAVSFDQTVTNNSELPRVHVQAVLSDATPVIADAEFKVTRSNTSDADLRVTVDITQTATYIDNSITFVLVEELVIIDGVETLVQSYVVLSNGSSFFVTIPAGETEATVVLPSIYGGNMPGNLTGTVAPHHTYLPAIFPRNEAAVTMKVPTVGSHVTISHMETDHEVTEGGAFNVVVKFRTADGVATPRGRLGFALRHREDTALGGAGSDVAADYDGAFVGYRYVESDDWTPDGTAFQATKTVQVQTKQDTLAEGTEQFQVLLSPSDTHSAAFNTDCQTGTELISADAFDDDDLRDVHACAVTVTIKDDGDLLTLQRVEVQSTPTGDFYAVGDKISFGANFNGAVTVTGTPKFTFDLGGDAREAAFTSAGPVTDFVDTQNLPGTHNVIFQHTVTTTDKDDHDGIAWNADQLTLNSGTINLTHMTVAEQTAATLNHTAQTALADQRVDTMKPSIQSAVVGGTTVTLNFSEELDTTTAPAASAFLVTVATVGSMNTVSAAPTAVSMSGRSVFLTIGSAPTATQSLTATYAKPSTNKIKDLSGKEADGFSGQAVTKDTTPPVQVAAVLAADGRTLTVTYNEALSTASVPINGVFKVDATPVGGTEDPNLALTASGVSVTGSTVVLKLEKPILHDHGSVKVSYAKPGSGAVIEDLGGNDAASFMNLVVTNNSTVPRVSIEAVYDDATPLIAPPVFKVTRDIASDAPLTVNVTITQDAQYIADNYFTDTNLSSSALAARLLTIPANLESVEKAIFVPTASGSHGNGALTLTVAGGDDHVPGSTDSATVQMKMPVSNSPLLLQNDLVGVKIQQTEYSVTEPNVASDLNFALIATTAKGVAKPRAYDFSVAIYTEELTATINIDYDHISTNIFFKYTDWSDTGDGAYTQTVKVPDLKINPDNEHEADETFDIRLQNTPGVSQRFKPDRTIVLVTIDDDDALDVAWVRVVSMPLSQSYYQIDKTISFQVDINGEVKVTGTPRFAFRIGDNTRYALYAEGTGTKELLFSYTVVSGDDDHDGISWPANALSLNGGTIKFDHTDPLLQIDALLGHPAGAALPAHKVDATTPTLVSAKLNRTKMTLTFSEELKTAAPVATAFTVQVVDGADPTPSAVAVDGRVVTVTLPTSVPNDKVVTVSYSKPTSGTTLQDPSGKEVVSFSNKAVDNDPFKLVCDDPSAVWCSDLEFSDQTVENWGWAYLRYGRGYDPPSRLSDQVFTYDGEDYTVVNMELRPGTHPVMPNAWSTEQQGYSSFNITVKTGASLRQNPPKDQYQDWVLHLEGLTLAFKDALPYGHGFLWVGPEIQLVFDDWSPSEPSRIGIQKILVANQDTDPLLPWAPMQVDASPRGTNGLRINWAKPSWTNPGLPDPTKYIVEWKLAAANWDTASQQEVTASSNFHTLAIDGLTRGSLYSVRVIAANDAGNGPPSQETLGRPQSQGPQLLSQTVNAKMLTLRFERQLDTDHVPAVTSFVVMADGGLIAVASVAVSGREVALTLSRAVTAANSVLVRYDKPTDTSGVFLQDNNGNHAQVAKHLELLPAANATASSSVQPLTAMFNGLPGAHNGRSSFSFVVAFSEPVWIGLGLARDNMLDVDGGTVISAPWKDRRSDEITVTIRPHGDGPITIALPANRTCAGIIRPSIPSTPARGAPCAIGNRALATASTTWIIPGP